MASSRSAKGSSQTQRGIRDVRKTTDLNGRPNVHGAMILAVCRTFSVRCVVWLKRMQGAARSQ